MTRQVKALVRSRAEYACEYCRLPQAFARPPHQIDHIIAAQHLGDPEPDNLALACLDCNLCKGPNLAGVDPASGRIIPLFHPRRDRWDEHFTYEGAVLVGQTPTGRVTLHVLQINAHKRVTHRQAILDEGRSFSIPFETRDGSGAR